MYEHWGRILACSQRMKDGSRDSAWDESNSLTPTWLWSWQERLTGFVALSVSSCQHLAARLFLLHLRMCPRVLHRDFFFFVSLSLLRPVALVFGDGNFCARFLNPSWSAPPRDTSLFPTVSCQCFFSSQVWMLHCFWNSLYANPLLSLFIPCCSCNELLFSFGSSLT